MVFTSALGSVALAAQRAFSRIIYPVQHGDWYQEKGYSKESGSDAFTSFVKEQQSKDSKMPAMKELSVRREPEKTRPQFTLSTGDTSSLDTVTLTPNNTENKVGKDKHVIYIGGRSENFESRTYREASEDAANLGITAHLFNLPGMRSSTGRMSCLDDGTNAVIAQVKRLIEEGVEPHNIILKGNCLGAWIAGSAQDELSKQGIMVRGVRSNTFSTLEDVVVAHTPSVFVPVVKTFSSLMKTLGWSYDASEVNLVNGPFVLMVNREGDRVIPKQALLSAQVSKNRETSGLTEEDLQIPGYSEDQKFFNTYGTTLSKKQDAKGDAHVLKFNDLEWRDENGKTRGGQELFAEYIRRSDKWIQDNPQECGQKKEPKFKNTVVPVLNKQQEKQATQFVATVNAIENTRGAGVLKIRGRRYSNKTRVRSPSPKGRGGL